MAQFKIMVGDTLHDVIVHSAPELVKIMHANSFAQCADDQAWMEETALRFHESLAGKCAGIRTHSAEAFVNDMARYGLITYVPDEVFPEEK